MSDDCGHEIGIQAMVSRIAQLETALNQCQSIALRVAEENPEPEGDTEEKRAHGPEWNRVALAIEYEIKAVIDSVGLARGKKDV